MILVQAKSQMNLQDKMQQTSFSVRGQHDTLALIEDESQMLRTDDSAL